MVEVGAFVALGVLLLLMVSANLAAQGRAKRIERALAAQRRTLVEEAHGTVRITGRVRRIGELLRAPLSGRPCVAYYLFVDEAGGDSTSQWYRIVEREEACPFMVADESGEARVDTTGPFQIGVIYDRGGRTSWLDHYPGKHRELGRFLESLGFVTTNWLRHWRSFQYGEGVIEEGQVVKVGGASAREVDTSALPLGPRSAPERVVLRGSEDLPLLISGVVR